MHAKEMGGKIDPGWVRLGKKMDQLVVYTSLWVKVIREGFKKKLLKFLTKGAGVSNA